MNSADQNRQSLVFADGYSYTEIFQAPEMPGMPSSNRLISVFHAFFTSDRDTGILDGNLTQSAPADAIEVAGENF
jgi:hypothetical protein